MSIDRFDYFISAARYGSFTKAAMECGVAQSAISQSIASLERELQCALFARSANGVCLTPRGQAFFEDALRLKRRYEQAVTHARDAAAMPECLTLAIGVGSMADGFYLRELLTGFKSLHPALELVFSRSSPKRVYSDLYSLFYDVAFTALPGEERRNAECGYLPFGTKRLTALLPTTHPLAKAPELTLDALLRPPGKLYVTQAAHECMGANPASGDFSVLPDADTLELMCAVNGYPGLDMRSEQGRPPASVLFRALEDSHGQRAQCFQYHNSNRSPALGYFLPFLQASEKQ